MAELIQLTEKRKEKLARMPLMESKIFKSKDGNYIVHKTLITDIKPVKYYDKVMSSLPETEVEEQA